MFGDQGVRVDLLGSMERKVEADLDGCRQDFTEANDTREDDLEAARARSARATRTWTWRSTWRWPYPGWTASRKGTDTSTRTCWSLCTPPCGCLGSNSDHWRQSVRAALRQDRGGGGRGGKQAGGRIGRERGGYRSGGGSRGRGSGGGGGAGGRGRGRGGGTAGAPRHWRIKVRARGGHLQEALPARAGAGAGARTRGRGRGGGREEGAAGADEGEAGEGEGEEASKEPELVIPDPVEEIPVSERLMRDLGAHPGPRCSRTSWCIPRTRWPPSGRGPQCRRST